ncbi:MAG: ABC transporter permease subunit [Chloroflexi bacterium]|nr:ABC transporter permease subunit [Chloroflexota bacterium]
MSVTEILSLPHAAAVDVAPAAASGLWRRLWQHNEARVGLIAAFLLLLLAIGGPLVLPYDPDLPDYAAALQPPSRAHLLGTDHAGRDLLARLMDGARRSLGASLLVLSSTFTIGLVVGVVAGMAGGALDTLLMRIVDILMTLPGMVLAMAVIGLLGPGFQNLLVALIIADWAYYARLARSYVLTATQRPDVIAARLAGISWSRIIWGHVLPGVMTQMAIIATLGLGGMITAISGFSFLGLGVQPPLAEWGSMLSDARFYFPIAPWLLLAPAGLIFAAVLAANLIGNALRDLLDPTE